MLHLATDASYDSPICSCGYVLTRSTGGSEKLVETGSRVLNTEADNRDIDWCSGRAEYRALITGVRAALDYTDEVLLCYSDNDGVVRAIQRGGRLFESYFQHALFSFLPRFADWHITNVDRERNETAHKQARVGLNVARRLLDNNSLQHA